MIVVVPLVMSPHPLLSEIVALTFTLVVVLGVRITSLAPFKETLDTLGVAFPTSTAVETVVVAPAPKTAAPNIKVPSRRTVTAKTDPTYSKRDF